MLPADFLYNRTNDGLEGIVLRKLAWTCGGFCGAIFLAHYLLHGHLLLWAGVAAALSIAAGWTRRDALRRAVLCLFGAALGFSWYALALRQIAPLEDLPWEERTIAARVTAYPRVYDNAVSLTVRITSPELAGLKARISDYDCVTGDLRPGDEISALVKLRTGAIHYGKPTDQYLSQGIQLSGYLRQAPEKTGVWRWKWLCFPQELTHALIVRADSVFPQDTAAFGKALMLGEKQALYDENLDIPLRSAGIMHAVAVSGMHLAFLLGFFRLVGGRSRRAALLTIPALAVFVLMAGASPSVVRAAIMASLFLLAPIFGRETDPATSFCAALAVLLAANPFSAGSVSLQLSFGALLGIFLVTGRISEEWLTPEPKPGNLAARLWRAVKRYFVATLATSVGAMLFTIPLSAVHFGTVALAAPVTNLLVLWLLPTAFLGCYGAVLASFVWLPLGKAAGWLVGWALRYVLLMAKALGGVRALQLSTLDRRVVLWLIAVYVIFFGVWLLRRFGRWKYLAAAVLCAALLVLAVSLTRADSLRTPRFTAVDVGQGQCLIVSAADTTVMIDCGGGAVTDNAGDLAAQTLCAQQRDRVDTLCLAHPHGEHVNGVCRLLLQIPVGRIILPAAADPAGKELSEILALAETLGVEVVRQSEDAVYEVGPLRVQLFVGVGVKTEDGCMLLRVTHGDYDALITGDAPAHVEQMLAAQTDLSGTELYVVGHHGSSGSSSDALLDALGAETAIVSCGYNSYGHPTPETLSRLEEHNITIYRTDLDGTVTVRME